MTFDLRVETTIVPLSSDSKYPGWWMAVELAQVFINQPASVQYWLTHHDYKLRLVCLTLLGVPVDRKQQSMCHFLTYVFYGGCAWAAPWSKDHHVLVNAALCSAP